MKQETILLLKIHYESKGKKLEEKTKEWIEKNISHPFTLSVSSGKDSMVTAYLCRDSFHHGDSLFFVNPGRYAFPGTEQAKDMFLQRFNLPYREALAKDYFEIARSYGLTDIDRATFTKIKKRPAFQQEEEGKALRIWGIRAEESMGRRMYMKQHGKLAWIKKDSIWVMSPILDWTSKDIWSVIIANQLPYIPIYDKYDQIGLLESGRSGTWAGTNKAQYGRLALLRKFYPDLYNELAHEFPQIRQYS